MKFRIKKLFSLVSISVFGLILAFNLIVNAQTTPSPAATQGQCSILPSEKIKVDGKDVKNPISLILSDVVNDQGKSGEVSLGDRVKVTINGLSDAIKKDSQFDPQQLVLQLNGYPLKGIHGTLVGENQLVFQLTHQEESRNEWNAILGSAWNGRRDVELSIGCPDGQKIEIDKEAKNSKKNVLTILLWQSFRMLIILFPIAMLIHCLWTPAMRDAIRGSGISSNRAFSLGRFQIAWWSYLVFFAFLGLFALTGSYTNIVTPQSMVLLGISSATAVGSSVIDSSKNRQLELSEVICLKNLEHRFEFLIKLNNTKNTKNYQKNIEDEIIDIDLRKAEMDDLITKELEQNAKSRYEQEKEAIDSYKVLLTSINNNKQRLAIDNELEKTLKTMNSIELQSENFLHDILTNPSGEINLHRYQIFIWTIVLGSIFVYQVLVTFKMPEFDTTLLALQGISSGTFLALKTQE